MMYTSGASSRRPVPELPQSDFPRTPPEPDDSKRSGDKTLPYLRLMWAHRRMLGRVTLYALLISAAVAYLIPKKYETTARLMPPDNQSTSGLMMAAAAMTGGAGGGGGLAGLASDVLGLKSSSDIFVGVLGSRTVADKLIAQFDLKKVYHDNRMEDLRKDLAQHTYVSVDRKSQIISITVTDRDPRRAAAIAQGYIEELNRLVADLSTSSARRERIFLEGRLKKVNKDLEDAERDFSQFASKNTAVDVKEQAKAMVGAAATLQGEMIAAQSQYEGLRQIYTDSNPRVRTIKARIDELQRQLDKLGGKGESATDVESAPGDSFYPSIRKLPLLGVTYADLYRQTRIQEAVLEALTKEYEMAKVQEVKEIPTVKILDIPAVPDKKSFPPRLLIIFLGTVSAFVGATVWLFSKTAWDQTDKRDARKMFAQEIFSDLRSHLPRLARHGSSSNGPGETALAAQKSQDRDGVER
jgi:capsule polysaccharide export protein KpsE/RkpR